jgi:hypothetical protein
MAHQQWAYSIRASRRRRPRRSAEEGGRRISAAVRYAHAISSQWDGRLNPELWSAALSWWPGHAAASVTDSKLGSQGWIQTNWPTRIRTDLLIENCRSRETWPWWEPFRSRFSRISRHSTRVTPQQEDWDAVGTPQQEDWDRFRA